MITQEVKQNLVKSIGDMVARIVETSGLSPQDVTDTINNRLASVAEGADKDNNVALMTPKRVHTAVAAGIAEWVGDAPEVLDTIKEIADALGGDPDAFNTLMNAITKLRTDINEHGNMIPIDMTDEEEWLELDFAHFETRDLGVYNGTIKVELLAIPNNIFDVNRNVKVEIVSQPYLPTDQTPPVGEEKRRALTFVAKQGLISYIATTDSRNATGSMQWTLATNGAAPTESPFTVVDFSKAPWSTLINSPSQSDINGITPGRYLGSRHGLSSAMGIAYDYSLSQIECTITLDPQAGYNDMMMVVTNRTGVYTRKVLADSATMYDYEFIRSATAAEVDATFESLANGMVSAVIKQVGGLPHRFTKAMVVDVPWDIATHDPMDHYFWIDFQARGNWEVTLSNDWTGNYLRDEGLWNHYLTSGNHSGWGVKAITSEGELETDEWGSISGDGTVVSLGSWSALSVKIPMGATTATWKGTIIFISPNGVEYAYEMEVTPTLVQPPEGTTYPYDLPLDLH